MDDIVTEKTCTNCLKTKPLSEFGKSSRAKDGKRANCKECHNRENRKYILEHPEKEKEWRLRNYEKHPEKALVRSILWRRANPEKYKAAQRKSREKYREKILEKYKDRRKLIIKQYGGKCSCCGEESYEFLAIDHVNGGGNKHRKESTQDSIYRQIIKDNFPPTYRILCHNCNLSLGFYGYCPHNR